MSNEASTKSISNDNSSVIQQALDPAQPIQSSTQQLSINSVLGVKFASLLTGHQQGINIDQQFILRLTKDIKNVSKEVKNFCKILHFSSEWSFEEVLATIDGLDPKDYPQLFIFVVELSNFEFLKSPVLESQPKKKQKNKKVKKIKKALSKFSTSRPLLLQLTSVEENVTKIRYKDEGAADFMALEDQKSNFWDARNFPAFLWDFLHRKFEDFEKFEDKLEESLPDVHKSSLLLKFLATLNLSEAIFSSIILEVSKTGTKAEFLAALDAPFDDNIGMFRNSVENYLSNVISDDEDQEDPANDPSVLLTAVQHQNTEISDYLITYWTHLIQQLPFEHQVRITTVAHETNQLDVLCDLLDIADFPFPMDFKAVDFADQNLHKIVNERQELADAIKAGNFTQIKQFIDNNPSIRIAYNQDNKSALQQAIDAQNYKVYFYLKSYGFKASEFDDLAEVLTADELKAATQQKIVQRRQNVNEALTENQKSVNLLCNRSFIHNRRISKEQEVEYRKNIRKWYEDINKIKFGDLFLDVAASCDDLKIIFDFNNCSTENVSFQDAGTQGSMYQSSKWIFVGAKLADSNNKPRNQKIKGVLAHELCHYVMKLVYENQENPYYKIMIKIAELFEEIVKEINNWSAGGPNIPDDECDGIISTVFRLYLVKDFHPELIVRVVQILAEFDDDQDKSQYLQDKYRIIFNFWENYVIPELRSFNLKSRESVRKMNRLLELLNYIRSEIYFFYKPKDIKTLFDNELTIVTTNVPTLLLNEIINYQQDIVGDLMDTENVFVDPDELKNKGILEEFKNLLKHNPSLNVIVDCSSEMPKDVGEFKGSRTIFVVSSEDQCGELLKAMDDPEIAPTKLDINYKWSDLTQESQELLLNQEISFQDWTGLTLLELLMSENFKQQPESSEAYKTAKSQALIDFTEIVDDQFLNLLVNDSDISIDVQEELESSEKGSKYSEERNFDFLFIDREFIKKSQGEIKFDPKQSIKFGLFVNREGQMTLVPNISEDQLLFDVQDKPVVLISDIAGNGKSWVMKNFARSFRQDESVKWVTFVDLKQFINEFKAQKGEPEFADFMTEKILKPRQQFEAKIFQKLYKIGKILVFFDGFDEIAPDCAEFVSKLAQNFQQNGGNQLWIATRDYFEVDLQQKLNTDAVYKLRELDKGEVTTFIAQSWLLMENDLKFKSSEEFFNYVRNPKEKYPSFVRKAHKIVDKHFSNWLSPVGMPHLLAMIAECYKNDKDGIDFNLSIIFEKFMERQYEKWCYEKGPIRKVANIKSQKFDMNFWKLHQYFAIAVLFPDFLAALFYGCDVSDWTAEEIVACGLMSKFSNNIFFGHETYGEFFVADLVANGLKKSEIDGKILELFVKILTSQRHVIIRSFINGLVEGSTLDKLQPKMKEIVGSFDKNSSYKFENFMTEIFVENLEKFMNFTVKFIKTESYKNRQEILYKSAGSIAINSKDIQSFNALKILIFDSLNLKDLKELILNCGLLSCIIRSNLEFTEFESFIKEIAAKTDKITVKKGLISIVTLGFGRGNIFYHLSQSPRFNPQTFNKILQICQNYLTFNEICGQVRHCNDQNHSILNLCMMTPSYVEFKDFWRGIVILYSSHCSSQLLKEFFKQEDSNGFIVLDHLVKNTDINLQKDFWDILLQIFDNREELADLILKSDRINNANHFQKLMFNQNPAIIAFVVRTMQQNLTKVQYTKIIRSYGFVNLNLLQVTVTMSKIIDVHRLVWKLVRETCKSDAEFSNLIQEIATDGTNILHYCGQCSPREVFEFIIEGLEKYSARDEIKGMLSHTNIYGYSVLHYCALQNGSLELHTSVWKVTRKYFDTPEIANLVQQVDKKSGQNLLFCALIPNSLQILELTWNEIKQVLNLDEQVRFLKVRNNDGKNMLDITSSENIGNDKIEWVAKLFKE